VYGLSVEVLATAGFALSSVDERKDSAGMTSDTSQILPSSNQNIYTSERSEESHPGQRFFASLRMIAQGFHEA
jgi:hypothetical protein